MKDMLHELMQSLCEASEIKAIKENGGLKSYQRWDELPKEASSITISPLGPPESEGFGSNRSLMKHFVFQISVESINRMESKALQRKIELILQRQGFYQMSGGLDEYFVETNRYVDSRYYEGNSRIYEDY
ncbi:hypothetical protein [Lactococcus lactis]|uniref:Phage protein n=1 Tax=Lactococcus lactis TaxID=1358 RepID=A0AAW5TS79_9LACT|nr:hypothetical protein [Lactococcus lactis]MCW2279875.1 hypothetical protein [Lactococcus lactis]MCW2280419.1 hypothetical protein [Lactococcus lactis]